MQIGRKKLLDIMNINLLADFTEVMPLIFEPVEMSASYWCQIPYRAHYRDKLHMEHSPHE